MTVPQFSRPGAVDLSAFRPSSTAPSSRRDGGGRPAGGSYVVEITGEESITTEVVNRSTSVVVLLSVWAPDVPESVEINATLSELANEFAGRFVLATLDAKAHDDLVAAIGIPSVPLVAAALRGQLAPLFQEPIPIGEMRTLVQQILQAAATNGITGTAEPTVADVAPDEVDDVSTARWPEAEEALLRGDHDDAIALYEAALATAPADPEAVEGLARTRLMKRTTGLDPVAARAAAAASPDDVEAQMLVADLDLLGGHVDDAFGRLVELLRRTTDTDRDVTRRHLLDLFTVVGDADPRVGAARRALTAALF